MSDSWHNLIKPSSSILSQKSDSNKQLFDQFSPAKTEQKSPRKEEELWGFAAAAARKKVTPVLHLVKDDAPSCYPSYNIFLSNIWNKNPLKNVTNLEMTTYSTSNSDLTVKSDKNLVSNEILEDLVMPVISDQLPLSLSPSKLVKSAVISKQYEHVRRNMLSSNLPFFYVNQLGDVVSSDKETIKKKLIAEATKTRHFQVCRHLNHLSVQPVSVPPPRPYNLSGKRITSYLSKQTKYLSVSSHLSDYI